MISADRATLKELQTDYSTEDLYLLLELIAVDLHNRRVAEEK